MLEFESFLSRYGEVVAQAILENLERFEGVRANTAVPLKDRWQHLMQDDARTNSLSHRLAA